MRTLILLTVAAASACTTQRVYPGTGSSPEGNAIVRADPAFSAGLPVQVRLRKAGDRRISLRASAIELPPGPHTLLVDCRVQESGATSRFTIEADLEAGHEYRLVARASTRNCDAVELIEQ